VTFVPEGTSLQVPTRYKSGGIVPPCPAAMADEVILVQHSLQGAPGPSEQSDTPGASTPSDTPAPPGQSDSLAPSKQPDTPVVEESPAKRQKVVVAPEAVQFYFEYTDIMIPRGLSVNACIRQLQFIAPELYSSMDSGECSVKRDWFSGECILTCCGQHRHCSLWRS
jgi:hypothetical protein